MDFERQVIELRKEFDLLCLEKFTDETLGD